MPLPPRRVLRTFKYAMYFNGVDDYVSRSMSWSGDVSVILYFRTVLSGWSVSFYDLGWSSRLFSLDYDIWRLGGIRWEQAPYIRGVVWGFWDINRNGYRVRMGIPLDTWIMVAGTNQRGVLKLYLNDSLITQADYSAYTMNSGTGTLYIGRESNVFIACALVYSRALSDSEVQWNYQYPDNPIRNGLVLWLHADPQYVKDIDNDGVLEWVDLSGYNNHGKIYGAQLVELVKAAKRVLKPARVLRAVG